MRLGPAVEEAELFARAMEWRYWNSEKNSYPCYKVGGVGVFVFRYDGSMSERFNPRHDSSQAIELAEKLDIEFKRYPRRFYFDRLPYEAEAPGTEVICDDDLCTAICDCAREILKGGRT